MTMRTVIVAVVVSALCGATDEFHQHFVPSRQIGRVGSAPPTASARRRQPWSLYAARADSARMSEPTLRRKSRRLIIWKRHALTTFCDRPRRTRCGHRDQPSQGPQRTEHGDHRASSGARCSIARQDARRARRDCDRRRRASRSSRGPTSTSWRCRRRLPGRDLHYAGQHVFDLIENLGKPGDCGHQRLCARRRLRAGDGVHAAHCRRHGAVRAARNQSGPDSRLCGRAAAVAARRQGQARWS